jgi:hypothetical protein
MLVLWSRRVPVLGPSRAIGHPLHVPPAMQRAGASLALLILAICALLLLARSVVVQQAEKGCSECELAAFEPPLRAHGPKPTPAIASPADGASVTRPEPTLWFGLGDQAPFAQEMFHFGGDDAATGDAGPSDPWWTASFIATNTLGDGGAHDVVALDLGAAATGPSRHVGAGPAWSWNDIIASGIPRFSPEWRTIGERELERHFSQFSIAERDPSMPDLSFRAANVAVRTLATSDALPIGRDALLPGVKGPVLLDVFRAEASYGLTETITPSIQYFRATNAPGPRYAWPGSRGQTSAGLAAGLTFVPWSDRDSPVPLLNVRISARYVAYTEFAGVPRGATPSSALSLSLWGRVRF